MIDLAYSLICLIICVHATVDLNCSTRGSSRVRRLVQIALAGTSFAGVWRPAMDAAEGAVVSTALLAVLMVDCLIRHHWRHLYHDRPDRDLILRRLDRIG